MMTDPLLPGFYRDGSLVIREMPTDEVPHALFEKTLPRPAEVRRILSEGFGVHLVQGPPAGRDLRFLLDFVGLKYLGVVGVGLDTRVIGELRSLVSLGLTVAEAPETDLSGLSELRTFSGLFHPNESVLRCPELVSASFQETREGVVPPVPPQLRELSLISANNLQVLSSAGRNPSLTSLVIDGARTFDVASLREFSQLERISFVRVKDLVNIDALTDLPIRELGLLNCRRIDNPESLRDLHNASIGVAGSLAKELRPIAENSNAHWEFYRSY